MRIMLNGPGQFLAIPRSYAGLRIRLGCHRGRASALRCHSGPEPERTPPLAPQATAPQTSGLTRRDRPTVGLDVANLLRVAFWYDM